MKEITCNSIKSISFEHLKYMDSFKFFLSLFVLSDHTCGYCSLLPNLLKGFGWNPGKRMLKWFGEQLKERTGDSDITFKEVSECCIKQPVSVDVTQSKNHMQTLLFSEAKTL